MLRKKRKWNQNQGGEKKGEVRKQGRQEGKKEERRNEGRKEGRKTVKKEEKGGKSKEEKTVTNMVYTNPLYQQLL